MSATQIPVKATIPFVFAAALILGGASCVTQPLARPRACTQEAMQCPDGSYVGRTGPDCQFAACPSPSLPPPTLECSGPGGSCPAGYACIQKCGPPVARVGDPPPGYYCEQNEIASQPRRCPICLASNTDISTPNGDVNVKDVEVGTLVWSVNARGEKVASAVTAVSRAAAPPTHRVTHLALSDGREVWVSPEHPAADGRPLGSLRAGDVFDGAAVRSAELVPYWDRETYDILPDGDTGTYWANGILLRSTLFAPR